VTPPRIVAIEDIQATLKRHAATGQPVDVLALESDNEIISFVPEDMTVKVAAGIRLGVLQDRLAEFRQWLPLDPWDASVTIKRIIDENLQGPRRYGYGSVREHLIGMEMVLADGRLIQSGGNVVKNVAGYDLMKLFVGARQSLGVIATVTFKLLPIPARQETVSRPCKSASEAAGLTDRLLDSAVCPTVLDWYRLGAGAGVNVCCAFAGTGEQVDWQLGEIADFGMTPSGDANYEREFFDERNEPTRMSSVLPSRLAEAVGELGGAPFVARAGNGVVWSKVTVGKPTPRAPGLENRLKETFDPDNLMPPLAPAC
jgi:hypothetical protein